MITRDAFWPMYPKYPPPGTWLGHSGRSSWNPQAGPVYELHTWAGLAFSLSPEKVPMDPSDPSTWRRPYVFTQ